MGKLKNVILMILLLTIVLVIVYICVLKHIKIEYKKVNDNIGKYENIEILEEEEVADSYLSKIIEVIESQNFEYIVSHIDRDNTKYLALSDVGIKEEFENMGISGKKLVKKEFSTKYVETLRNVFCYVLEETESGTLYNLVIKEYSPNIYTFGFVE